MPLNHEAVFSTTHGRKQRRERSIDKRDLQAAVKYDLKEPAVVVHGEQRWKYSFGGIMCTLQITEAALKSRASLQWGPVLVGSKYSVQPEREAAEMKAEHDHSLTVLRNDTRNGPHTRRQLHGGR